VKRLGAERFVGAALCALLASACVPERAGYDDVRSLTAERLGQKARWRSDAGSPGIDADTRKLLDQPLDAVAAGRIAVLNNQRLQASFERLGVARAELVQALRLPNPHVGGAVRYRSNRPDIDVDAMISLSDLAFLPLRSGAGNAGLKAAALEVAGQAIDVAYDARRALYEYQLAEQRLELSRSTLGSTWAASDMAARLHDAGNVTELVRASEQAAFEEARLEQSRAEAELLQRREELNEALGLFGAPAARWKAVGTLKAPQNADALVSDVESHAVRASLDLAATERRFEHAAKRANLSRAEGWLPELHAGVSAERAEEGWGIGPAAELEVPLFYQGQGETDAALSEMREQRALLSHTAVAVRTRARTLSTRLLAAERGLHFYEETVLPLRRRILQQTQLQYNAMQMSVFQLLLAKRDEIAARRARLDLLGEYWTVHNELERLLAGRLGSELPKASSATEGASAPAPSAH
jgi:outer membrane protein TolC